MQNLSFTMTRTPSGYEGVMVVPVNALPRRVRRIVSSQRPRSMRRRRWRRSRLRRQITTRKAIRVARRAKTKASAWRKVYGAASNILNHPAVQAVIPSQVKDMYRGIKGVVASPAVRRFVKRAARKGKRVARRALRYVGRRAKRVARKAKRIARRWGGKAKRFFRRFKFWGFPSDFETLGAQLGPTWNDPWAMP